MVGQRLRRDVGRRNRVDIRFRMRDHIRIGRRLRNVGLRGLLDHAYGSCNRVAE
jgi:hypothetical protein